MDTPAVFSIAVLAIIVLLVPYASRYRERKKAEKAEKAMSEARARAERERSATEFAIRAQERITREIATQYELAQKLRLQQELAFQDSQERIRARMEQQTAKSLAAKQRNLDIELQKKLERDREMLKEERENSIKKEN